MAVVQSKLFWTGQTGTWRLGGFVEYVSIHHVYTDDPRDGPERILNAEGIPKIGDQYVGIGNDADPEAVLIELTPNRVQGTRLKWEIIGRWNKLPLDGFQSFSGVNNEGEPTDDPLEEADAIEVGYAQFTEPIEDAIFRGGFTGQALLKRPVGSSGPIMSSVLTAPYDPALEGDNSHLVIRITKTQRRFPSANAALYQDAINKEQFTINKRLQRFRMVFPKYQAKVQNIGGSWQLVAGVSRWRVTYEIHRWDREWGWRFRVPDRDWVLRGADEGDPDGRGGVISASDLEVGVPRVRVATDGSGTPVPRLLLLDGDGQPIRPGDPAVYTIWSYYDELPFGPLNL